MTTTEHETVAPEVQEFLTAVHAQLTDLDPEEQREILDGLEAARTDLGAERGGEARGDPVAYARELRAAAGFAPETARVRQRVDLSTGVHSLLDDVHRLFDRLAGALPGDAAAVLTSLQPAWWALRAWLAVEIAAYFFGQWALQVIPGSNLPGTIAILVAVVLSVQLGRGRLWPHERWRTGAGPRVLLLGLNSFAVLMVPVVLSGLGHARTDVWERAYQHGFHSGFRSAAQQAPVTRQDGVYADGTRVSQIYPYDAKGLPLVGVQLFDQDGKAIDVVTRTECVYDGAGQPLDQGRQYFPWSDGAAQKHNVFPVPSKVSGPDTPDPDPLAFTRGPKPSVGPFPFASVAPVSLPGLTTSKGVTPSSAYTGGALPGKPGRPIDLGC
jgi:hypothetical protein